MAKMMINHCILFKCVYIYIIMTYTRCFQSYLDALVDKASNPNVGHVFFGVGTWVNLDAFPYQESMFCILPRTSTNKSRKPGPRTIEVGKSNMGCWKIPSVKEIDNYIVRWFPISSMIPPYVGTIFDRRIVQLLRLMTRGKMMFVIDHRSKMRL